MIIVTCNSIANMRVTRTLGLARGTAVRGRHLGKDLIAHFRNAVGGEITEYTKMLSEAREQAIDRLSEDARSLGGNAIIGLRFTTSTTMAGTSEVIAYGTAVVIEEITDPP